MRIANRLSAALVAAVMLLSLFATAPATAVSSAAVEPAVAAELAKGADGVVFAIMRAKADLTVASAIKDWDARGRAVVAALKATAAKSQAGLHGILTARGIAHTGFWAVNAVRIQGADTATVGVLAARADVKQIVAETTVAVDPVTEASTVAALTGVEWGLTSIGADRVWSDFGTRGEGIVVGTIDTGVLYTHPALVGSYRGNNGDGTFSHDYNWYDPSNACATPSLVPCDNNGHGTHTMGTIAGDDGTNRIGVAPGVRWIAAKGCESGTCSTSALLASGQWMLAPTRLDGTGADASKRPQVVSNSWGGGQGSTWYSAVIDDWRAAGMVPVFSNGNSGPACGTANTPGEDGDVIGVGAYDVSNVIASFSSRGPTLLDGLTKPDISAPGVSIRSSYNNGDFASLSGTSMAAPHVAGAIALVLSAAPSLIGQPTLVQDLLETTATPVDDATCGGTATDNNVWGHGRLDVYAAISAAPRSAAGLIAGTVTDSATGSPIAGAAVALTGSSTRQTTTDASGAYRVLVSVGTYAVSVSRYGYATAGATGVVVAENATTTTNITLTALPSHSVSGIVRDAAGSPLAGTQVSVSASVSAVTTGADGVFTVPGLQAGTYTVTATPADFCQTPATASVTISTADVTGLAFTIAARTTASGYTCRTGAGAHVAGTDLVALAGDDATAIVTLPFAFPYFGASYTTATIDTNGRLDFASGASAYTPVALPNAATPNAVIAPSWADLVVDASAGVYTATTGTTPNRAFVIEWRNATFYASSATRITFSAVLHENGAIDFTYGPMTDSDLARGTAAAVGIEDAAGTEGIGYAYRTAALATSRMVTFLPPAIIPTYTLGVARAGAGTGTVASADAGIACGATCSATYASGTVVTLTATPAANSTFTGWSGDCTGIGTCQVTMDQARSVTATFALAPTTLTVTVAGAGTVKSNPIGITCPGTCAYTFASGTTVTLTATATTGNVFAGWSGACTNATGTCAVSLTTAKSVTATFKASTVLAYTGPTTATTSAPLTLTATLKTSAGAAVVGQTVSFKVGAAAAVTAVTSGSGIASVTTTAPVTAGSVTVTVSYAGGTGYAAAANKTATLAVKSPTTLTFSGSTPAACLKNTSCTLRAVFKVAGVATSGVTGVKFVFNGKSSNGSTTSATGESSVAITMPRTAGTYTLSITWAGTTTRLASSWAGTLTVK